MSDLSDIELRNRLQNLGFNAPPVTDDTRSLLLNKLHKLEKSTGNASNIVELNMSDLTDIELRKKLLSLGFDTPPVTDTTRELLLNKLHKLEKSVGNASNIEVSSADESDTSRSSRSNRSRSKRPVLPSPVAKEPASEASSGWELRRRNLPDSTSVSNISKPVIMKKLRNSEEAENIPDLADISSAEEDGPNLRDSRNKKQTRPPLPKFNDAPVISVGARSRYNISEYNSGSDVYDSRAGRVSNEHLFEVRNQNLRESSYSTFDARNNGLQEPGQTLHRLTEQKDRINNFAQSTPIGQDEQYFRSHNVPSTSAVQNMKKQSFLSRSFHGMDPATLVLLLILIFFFGLLFVYQYNNNYMGQKTGLTDLSHLICSGHYAHNMDCLESIGIHSTEAVLDKVYGKLHDRAAMAYCSSNPDDALVSNSELYQFMIQDGTLSALEADKALYGIKMVARLYPNLSILAQENSLMLKDPHLPWSCTMKKSFYSIVYNICCILAGLSVIVLFHFTYKWIKKSKENHDKEIQQLIQSIRVILQRNAISNPDCNYLPISVVQSQAIPLEYRKKKQKIWEEAARSIESIEPRIRRETQPYNGEDYHVWRWLSQEQSVPRRKWHGEAFETTKGTINSPVVSPTQCLKIRHIFDPNTEEMTNELITVLHNAILERCEKVKIVHIAIDKDNAEGCIYVKCLSTEDAGNAYRKIHGAWFDGKIVSVKYLRLERYHERFPESKFLVAPLLPSNNLKSSLQ